MNNANPIIKDRQKKTGVNSDAPININSNGSVVSKINMSKGYKSNDIAKWQQNSHGFLSGELKIKMTKCSKLIYFQLSKYKQ